MKYDIAFAGHMCFDEIVPYQGDTRIAPGSAVLCGAMAAARVGKRVAVAAKMSQADQQILSPMREAGIRTFIIPAHETSYMQVIHPSADVDERRMYLKRNAGFISADEMPEIDTAHLHLAGISDQEFTLDFIRSLAGRGLSLSADMQSFVRQVHPGTREVLFRDVPAKRQIAALLQKVKLDVVEARLITGHSDLELAAAEIERWGCPEIVITESKGVLARADGKTFYEIFSNRSTAGRTGRGDTTFAGYLAWRMEHGPEESLRFAAALVSIKMETPGPFGGTLADVLARMNEMHSR